MKMTYCTILYCIGMKRTCTSTECIQASRHTRPSKLQHNRQSNHNRTRTV